MIYFFCEFTERMLHQQVGKVFIEYAGLMNDTEYAKKMEIKKELALKNQIRLIIITSSDLFRLDEILKDLIS